MHVKLFSKIHLPTSVLDCNVVATYVETIECMSSAGSV